MKFDSLKEKCEYYRSLTDYKILPNSNLLIMLDGHSFSKKVKNAFKKPFDEVFINAMDNTAKYLCESIQGAKIAYVQSDEITILVTDYDTPMTDSFFGYRLCKIQSIAASMAAACFNKIMIKNAVKNRLDTDNVNSVIEHVTSYDFDCKAWVVPNDNDAFAWFLYRQIDCIRNSKQQAAQAYIPHKELLNLDADKQIQLLKQKENIDWNINYSNGEKYGRFIYKTLASNSKILPNGKTISFTRNKWIVHNADVLTDSNTEKFFEIFRNDC